MVDIGYSNGWLTRFNFKLDISWECQSQIKVHITKTGQSL